jgi:hypothetical protein
MFTGCENGNAAELGANKEAIFAIKLEWSVTHYLGTIPSNADDI